MDEAAYRSAGLFDPDAPDAAQRLELLAFLEELGLSIEAMRAAHAEGRLAGLAVDPVLLVGGQHLTATALAEAAGVSEDTVRQVWRGSGFPDPGEAAVFTEGDVGAVRNAVVAIELFGEEAAFQFVRMLGSTTARLADAMLAVFEANIGTRIRAANVSDVEVARAAAHAASFIPAILQAIDPMLRHHLMAARRRRWASAVGPTTTMVRLGVGFADLVGYTGWSRERSGAELAAAVAELDARATDIAADHGGRVVKTIGDEAMFVAPDPGAVCEIALRLVDAFAGHASVPPLRAGLAFGEVLPQDGDYYGVPVNLAARAVGEAEPGQVLVDEAIAASAPSGLRIAPGRAATLKGFAEPVVLSAATRA